MSPRARVVEAEVEAEAEAVEVARPSPGLLRQGALLSQTPSRYTLFATCYLISTHLISKYLIITYLISTYLISKQVYAFCYPRTPHPTHPTRVHPTHPTHVHPTHPILEHRDGRR